MTDVLVVGGGAAGILAAGRAAACGSDAVLLEKNARLGLKIHISGGGKCNITHAGSMQSVRRGFVSPEAAFLQTPFRRFTNQDILEMLHARGVPTHARPDGRVFPDSGRAGDVVTAMEAWLRSTGATVVLENPVTGVDRLPGGGFVVETPSGARHSRALVVAVGGMSYPRTGTTGDGYGWAVALGHPLSRLRAALAPIEIGAGLRPEWSGVALRDVLLRARAGSRILGRQRGDLLYTHRGVSGPAVLEISRDVAVALEAGVVRMDADLLPETPPDQLQERMLLTIQAEGRRQVSALLEGILPDRLSLPALEQLGIPAETTLSRLARHDRNRLIELVKCWPLGEVARVPLEKGEVTAGGVRLEDVDAQSMESRLVPGLFFCGEILDLSGPVGGYNLQAAFSTGWCAGEAAARFCSRARAGAE